jgi:hypothetical protein
VKHRLGETELPASYIKYYLDALTGSDWSPWAVDAATLLLGLAALVLSCVLNWQDRNARVQGGMTKP